jgi:ABC-type dipeptide/oligopeptide/nickel transport system permease subunit
MASDGLGYLSTAPHMLIFPAIAISVTMLAFNLFGDGLRDALDPSSR